MKYFLLLLFIFPLNLQSQDDFEDVMEGDLEALENDLDLGDIQDDISDLEADLDDEIDNIDEDFSDEIQSKPKPKKKQKVAEKKKRVVPTKKEENNQEEGFEDFKEEKIGDIEINDQNSGTFDTGVEEQQLLSLADKISFKIEDSQWEQIKQNSNVTSTYQVQEGDWLFKISKNLFGTGHYYPKIWALNPYITNPHEIEPGMILLFDTGSGGPPSLSLQNKDGSSPYASDWILEKKKLIAQGVHVDYASDEMEKIIANSNKPANEEYKKYTPYKLNEPALELAKEYDDSGFSRANIVKRKYKQGFSVNTFITPNTIEDFGEITDGIKDSFFITDGTKAYIKASSGQEEEISEGDIFSVYEKSEEKIKHENSDRSGYKYSILGHVRVMREVGEEKWEVEVFGLSGTLKRGDRLTVYTPKIEKIYRRYNPQLVEAVIVDSHTELRSVLMAGDIAYIDRGREDGVQIGDVFGVFSNIDQKTKKFIDKDPVYLLGDMVVISLTEDFATILMLDGAYAVPVGSFAQTISEELSLAKRNTSLLNDSELRETEDQEVKEDLGEQVLEDAQTLELSEDELEELDRIENKKSYIDETEKDLGDSETLKEETDEAEDLLDSEDKKLIEKDLEGLEGELGAKEDELESIEKEVGKKYLDEELNEKENPYGLSENDLEEVDELLDIDLDDL